MCVPEGAIICRINTHRAVIAPPRVDCLHISCNAGQHRRLRLAQSVQRVRHEPSGIAYIGSKSGA